MTERDGVDAIVEQWRTERPDLDPSPIGIVGRVSRLARELEARLEPVYKAHGLEPGWHDVLATLRRSGPDYRLRPTDLTNATMLTSSGTTKRLDKLEQAGPDPARGRSERPPRHADHAHAAGRELIDSVTAAHLANERRLLEALDEDEKRVLADLLRKLLQRSAAPDLIYTMSHRAGQEPSEAVPSVSQWLPKHPPRFARTYPRGGQ